MHLLRKVATPCLLSLILITLPLSAQAPRSNPEGVGISAERLKRVSELLKRHIDAGSFSGSVTLVARNGRVAHLEAQGLMDIEGYGLSVRVVNDAVQRGTLLSSGTFGWSGAYGTHFFVDPKEKVVAVLMTQTSTTGLNADFENAVMQSIVEPVELN
jgi:hypothetical protein